MPHKRIVFEEGDKTLLLTPGAFFEKIGVQYTQELKVSKNVRDLALSRVLEAQESDFFDAYRCWLKCRFLKEYTHRDTAPLVIRFVDQDLGYGVFAFENLPPHSYIATYAGELKKRSLLVWKRGDYAFLYPSSKRHFRPLVIDAKSSGNETRFINHSDDPNCETMGLLFNELIEVVFFTTRPIQKGEQLTVDYGKRYWKKRSSPSLI